MAPSGAGQPAHAFVSPFGEKLDSSRALHPQSAARYFVDGIPPSRLACVRWRITRTVVAPFPCARSLHMRRLPDLPLWRVFLRSICARRRSVSSLNLIRDRFAVITQSTNWESTTLAPACAARPTASVDMPSWRRFEFGIFGAGVCRGLGCQKSHFSAEKVFYDLRLDLRFVW